MAEYGSDEDDDEEGANGATASAPGGLPAGFFDDPSQAPPPRADTPPLDDVPPAADDDQEWAAFEATLDEPEPVQAETGEAFSRATVMAEPVMFDAAGAEAGAEEPEPEEEEEEGPKETDEERRIREEKEEIMDRIETCASALFSASLALTLLLREEREQAEADERVNRMKARLDAIRAARQAKAANKT